jgi:A/G-specific adenine glycosylase
MNETIALKLLQWYAQHRRSFPFRDAPTPYAVWVSEVMAQQTRMETVLPYFQRWMERFPSVESLAAASQQEVLNLWEGLGYYSRGRNLHKAARIVMADYGGELPDEYETLLKLPGIGRYTAGAIASIAFGQDRPVVDGNVKRVYARLFAVETPINTPAGEKEIWALAEAQLPAGQAGDYNQALMDLGATICLPRQPDCTNCPLQAECLAYQRGLTAELPRKKQAKKPPHYTVTAAVMEAADGSVLITQRPQDALLGGLWEFPGGKREDGESLKACLKREILEELGVKIKVGEKLGVFRHAYTHFKVTLHAYRSTLVSGEMVLNEHQAFRWVQIDALDDFPMGKIDRSISRQLQGKEPANGA